MKKITLLIITLILFMIPAPVFSAITLDNGDKIRGDASTAAVVDYVISGMAGSTLSQLADGQLADATGDLYTASAAVIINSIILVNTDTSARTVNLFLLPSAGTARRIFPKDLSLAPGYAAFFDGTNIKVITTAGVTLSNGNIDLASPGPIGGTTPAAGAFTGLAATTYGSDGSVTDTELKYIDFTSSGQTQMNSKQGTLTNSAGLLAALSDETGTEKAVFSDAPTFTTSITMGSAVLNEAELEVIDGADLTTTQLNYLNAATGTTGTTSTNLVYSTSPVLVTPTLGDATATSITIDASATPGWVFRDSDNAGTDKEIAKIHANSTTTTDGAEDGEMDLQVMDSGSEKTFIKADGDTGAEYVQVGPIDTTYLMHIYNSIPTVDGTWSGKAVVRTVAAGQTSVFGQVLHIHTDGELIVADADVASAAAAPGIFMALEAGTGAKLVLEYGYIFETDWNWTPGEIIYLDDDPTENEGLTAVAGIPATAGDQVQVLGIAISADVIKFDPSLVLVEVP